MMEEMEMMPATYAELGDLLELRTQCDMLRTDVRSLVGLVEKLQGRIGKMEERLDVQDRCLGQQIGIVNELKSALK